MHRSIVFVVALGSIWSCSGTSTEQTTFETPPTTSAAADTSGSSSETTDTSEPQPGGESGSSTSPVDEGETTDETADETSDEDGYTPYQACVRNECPEEADECHVYVAHVPVHYCTVFCDDDSECPPAPSGQTEPRCDPYLSSGYCALDCSAAACPAGMGCFDVTLVDQTTVQRCGWV